MALHAMIDLETMDTAPTAVVLSIGVVLFDPYSAGSGMGEHYWVLDTEEQDRAGRTRSESTKAWWAEQSPEARQVLTAQGWPVAAALRDVMPTVLLDAVDCVWANGSDFDCVIMRDLVTPYGYQWPFWKNRCHRTMKSLQLPPGITLPARAGTHHNALADAAHQARCLQTIVAALGLKF